MKTSLYMLAMAMVFAGCNKETPIAPNEVANGALTVTVTQTANNNVEGMRVVIYNGFTSDSTILNAAGNARFEQVRAGNWQVTLRETPDLAVPAGTTKYVTVKQAQTTTVEFIVMRAWAQ